MGCAELTKKDTQDNCNILAQDCDAGKGCYSIAGENLPVCLPAGTGPDCNLANSGVDDHPVNCVSWYEAFAFCVWSSDGAWIPAGLPKPPL